MSFIENVNKLKLALDGGIELAIDKINQNIQVFDVNVTDALASLTYKRDSARHSHCN